MFEGMKQAVRILPREANWPIHTYVTIADVGLYVHSQLPDRVADQVTIEVQSDAYRIRAKAIFSKADGKQFECWLERADDPRLGCCKIPDACMSQLCLWV
jgi:hypothetical protein